MMMRIRIRMMITIAIMMVMRIMMKLIMRMMTISISHERCHGQMFVHCITEES